MNLFCASCNAPLESSPDVGRGGELIDLVRPCARCVSRMRIVQRLPPPVTRQRRPNGPGKGGHNGAKPKRNAAGQLICVVCDTPLRSGQGRGRPRAYCDAHRTWMKSA